jgi:DNA repair exonuclease SbcCD ATPase subunit
MNLNFKYLKAQNIFCFGPEGIEIDFTKLTSNIVHLTGENLDVQDNEEEYQARNGVGKSSIPEIIVYGLFGKTIKAPKKLTHDDLINKKAGKKLYVEVQWDKYRVVRTRKPNSLRIWESEAGVWTDETEITLGGIPATQELIEKKLGIGFDTFINLLVFTDNNAGGFLECDGPTKREIVENLMNLQQFREDFDRVKAEKNSCKNDIVTCGKVYEQMLLEIQAAQRRKESIAQQEVQWRQSKQRELQTLLAQIEATNQKLAATDAGQALVYYNECQTKMLELKGKIPELEEKRVKIGQILAEAREKLEDARSKRHQLNLHVQATESEFQNAKTEIQKNLKVLEIKDKKGTQCPYCYGTISEQSYGAVVTKAKNTVEHYNELIKTKTPMLDGERQKVAALAANIKKLEEGISGAGNKEKTIANDLDRVRFEINKLAAVQKPEVGVDQKVLGEKIVELEKQVEAKKQEIAGVSPYLQIYAAADQEIAQKQTESENKKKEMVDLEDALRYLEYWVNGFSQKGIPKFAISLQIPALNNNIAYWLQYLIDGKISLTFNDELEETIQRTPPDGDPFVYYVMSGGERRRLNLSVSQAFAHLMSISSDTTPSVVFLDEVTSNIDPMGVVGVFNMIKELAKTKQVFVTTHDELLIELLSGCQTIFLEKKDGYTKIVNK